LKNFFHFEDILLLGREEHFDVILAFHILHHVEWQKWLPVLFNMADDVIIETPSNNDYINTEYWAEIYFCPSIDYIQTN
jgi:hypothetical protein